MTGRRSCTIAWTRSIRRPIWRGLSRAVTSWCSRISPTLQSEMMAAAGGRGAAASIAGTRSGCASERRQHRRCAVEWSSGQGGSGSGRKDHGSERTRSTRAMRCAMRSVRRRDQPEPIRLIVQADSFVSTMRRLIITMASATRRWSVWTGRRIIWMTSSSRLPRRRRCRNRRRKTRTSGVESLQTIALTVRHRNSLVGGQLLHGRLM